MALSIICFALSFLSMISRAFLHKVRSWSDAHPVNLRFYSLYEIPGFSYVIEIACNGDLCCPLLLENFIVLFFLRIVDGSFSIKNESPSWTICFPLSV